MTKMLSVLLFIAINSSPAFCQKLEKKIIKQIDDLIITRLNKISPGCVVLVSKKGKILYEKAFGTADLELNIAMRPNMVFRIGSITKQFTAIALLKLVEEGKIALTDSLQKFIKGFKVKRQAITIENLLTQTSGIPDYIEHVEYKSINPFRIDIPSREIVDSIKRLPLQFEPGSTFAYSNSNYFLLGYIIELVSGKTYPRFLQENIFLPAGLNNTFYEDPTFIIPNRIKGYEKKDNTYSNADFISMATFYSAGAIVSTVEDLFKWNQSLVTYKIVKKETLSKAFTPYQLSNGKLSEYGYGWFLRNIEGSSTIEHGGSIFGFRAKEIYLPDDDIYITALFNCRQADNNETNLCIDIAKTVLGKPLLKDILLPDTVLDGYVGTYIFVEKTSISLKIYKEKGRLYADLSNGTGTHMAMLAQSPTLFYLPDVWRIATTIEFMVEGKIVTGMNWTQQEKHGLTKTK